MKYMEYMKASTDTNGSYKRESTKDEVFVPVDCGKDTYETNEVFFEANTHIADESNISDKPCYTDAGSAVSKDGTKDYDKGKDCMGGQGQTGAFDEFTAASEAIPIEDGYTEDYGQRIADMNVDGMPWLDHMPDQEELLARLSEPQLNARETRKLIFSSLIAALSVAGVFILALFLFLLFCVHVWF